MIEFRNVHVNFRQNKKDFAAVQDVSFKVEKGKIFGIVGSSGAGKSTLLRTINGLQTVTSGEVIIDGINVEAFKGERLRKLRRNIGMIFQHFNLAESRTVYENIAFVLRAAGKTKEDTDRRVRELLDVVKLTDKIDAYPSRLSGGQKQRVAIARALANDAKILLCDEPTSALDLETTASILSLLKELNQKLHITIVVITHELDVVKTICERVAVMHNSKVVEIGNVYEIFTNAKDDYTKALISHTLKFDMPRHIISKLKGPVIKLTYHGDNANNPILSCAANTFEIGFNILLGKIEYINNEPIGVLFVHLIGEKETLDLAITWLGERTEHVEVIYNGI